METLKELDQLIEMANKAMDDINRSQEKLDKLNKEIDDFLSSL